MKKIILLHNQSLLDIALQYTGTAESVFAIAQANGMSVSAILDAGTEVFLPINLNTNSEIKNYYQARSLQPATLYEYIKPAGIGVMIIEDNFIIE